MNQKAQDENTPIERLIVLIEAASSEDLAAMTARLAQLPAWVTPIFVASPEEAERLESLFSQQDGVHLERARSAGEVSALLKDLGQQEERPSPWPRDLLRLSVAFSSIQDQESLLEELLDQALDVTPAVQGCVWLKEESEPDLQPVVCKNPPASAEEGRRSAETSLPLWAHQSGQAILLTAAPSPSLIPYTRPAHGRVAPLSIRLNRNVVRETLAIPVVAANRILGVVTLASDARQRSFDRNHFEAVSLMASQVAMTLEGARLFARVEQGKKEWEATFDAIGDSVLLISPDKTILRVNRAAARAAGLQFTDLVGKPCCNAVHGVDEPAENCPLDLVVETGQPASAEITDHDGDRVLQVSAYPILDVRGEVQAVVEHIRDVTHVKQAQARLMQAEKLSALGQLTAGVAHELNNPLTSILGFAQLLQRSAMDDHQRTYLDTILEQSKRSSRIVRNLLAFARRQEPERKMLDINEILKETLSLSGYQLQVSNIGVKTSLEDSLPHTAADPYQLQQIFLNVINNAQQAMYETHSGGTLTIRTMPVLRPAGYAHNSSLAVSDMPESTLEGWIRMEFADDGPGIPPDLLIRIFDPFFTTKKPGQGTGLGLSVCHGIVRDHGGHIWAESAPGRGATIVVELPVRSLRHAEVAPAGPARAPELPPGRILVVDDEEATLHLLNELLAQHGQEVDVAREGAEALEKLAHTQYDVILCDMRMPGVSGDDLYTHIKQRWPELVERIVFLTGDMASASTRAFLKQTGRPVVEKPFEVMDLVRAMQKVYRDVGG